MLEYFKPLFAIIFFVINLALHTFLPPENIPLQIVAALGTTLTIYALLPILFYSCPTIQRFLIFQHNVKRSKYVNYLSPVTEGITGARNVYVNLENGSLIGLWHILPISLVTRSELLNNVDENMWNNILRTSGKPVVVYMHGNTGSRALDHRKELYKVLQKLDYHVICCDYRGYADSSPVCLSETGVVSDGIAVYKWVKNIVGPANVDIFVWGHSLGSGISSHIVAKLCMEGDDKPKGLILESPFTSLGESIRHHKIAAPYMMLPAFDQIFVEPLKRNDIKFESDRHIEHIDIPIAILHCEDDQVVPFFLGKKLFKIGKRVRSADAKPIFFKGFHKGYSHKFICRSPELPGFVQAFMSGCASDDWNSSALQDYS